MNEPGIVDVRGLRLLRYPPGFDARRLRGRPVAGPSEEFDCGAERRAPGEPDPRVSSTTRPGLAIV